LVYTKPAVLHLYKCILLIIIRKPIQFNLVYTAKSAHRMHNALKRVCIMNMSDIGLIMKTERMNNAF